MPATAAAVFVVCAFGNAAASDGMAPVVAGSSLPLDDECSASEGGEACAVSAIQLRGKQVGDVEADSGQALSGERGVTLATACSADPIARMVSRLAPPCVEACPQLCEAALPVLAAFRADGGGRALAETELCTRRAGLACALADANAEACSPLWDEASLLDAKTPRTVSELDAMCSEERSNPPAVGGVHWDVGPKALAKLDREAVAEALLQRRAATSDAVDDAAQRHGSAAGAKLLDAALSGKAKDRRCRAKTGKTCAGKHTWIICELGYKVSGSREVSCEHTVGAKSICRDRRQAGPYIDHQHEDFCDDPFCRNGGAYDGDGKYCQQDHLIYCRGNDAPRIIKLCADKYWKDKNGTRRVHPNHCVGAPPNPDCLH